MPQPTSSSDAATDRQAGFPLWARLLLALLAAITAFLGVVPGAMDAVGRWFRQDPLVPVRSSPVAPSSRPGAPASVDGVQSTLPAPTFQIQASGPGAVAVGQITGGHHQIGGSVDAPVQPAASAAVKP